jgi:hypothetical protein
MAPPWLTDKPASGGAPPKVLLRPPRTHLERILDQELQQALGIKRPSAPVDPQLRRLQETARKISEAEIQATLNRHGYTREWWAATQGKLTPQQWQAMGSPPRVPGIEPSPLSLAPESPVPPPAPPATAPAATWNLQAPSGSQYGPTTVVQPPSWTGPIVVTLPRDLVRYTPPDDTPPSAPADAAPPHGTADGAGAPPAPAAPPTPTASPEGPSPGQAAAGPGAAGPTPATAPQSIIKPFDSRPGQAVQKLASMLDDPRSFDEIASGGGTTPPVEPLIIPPDSAPPPPPIRPQSAEDVATAAGQTAEPTPGQAMAGNYRMGKVNIDGLNISIETPLGGIRSGVGPDGKPWQVQMPADYGYIRGTKGADGDRLDTYLGPAAHEAPKHPVFIIDQIEPGSRNFDKHKVLIGFPSRAAARAAYVASFSDGSGSSRIGAITQMPWRGFRFWLEYGSKTRPVRYRRQNPPRTKNGRPLTLLQFLAWRGGLSDHGDLRAMDAHRKFIPGYGRLVRRAGGMDLDMAREAAEEAGYLRDRDGYGTTIADLLDAIDEELRGRRVYSTHEAGDALVAEEARRYQEETQREEDARNDVRGIAKQAGITNLRPEEIDYAVELILHDGMDPEDALAWSLERHAIMWVDEVYQTVQNAEADDIPFDFVETANGQQFTPEVDADAGDEDAGGSGAGPDRGPAAERPASGGGDRKAAGDRKGAQGGGATGQGQPGGGRPDQRAGQGGGNATGVAARDQRVFHITDQDFSGVPDPSKGDYETMGPAVYVTNREGLKDWLNGSLGGIKKERLRVIEMQLNGAVLDADMNEAARAVLKQAGLDMPKLPVRNFTEYDAIRYYLTKPDVRHAIVSALRDQGFVGVSAHSTHGFEIAVFDPASLTFIRSIGPTKTEKVDTLDGVKEQGLLAGVAEPLPGVRGIPKKKPVAQAEPGGMFSSSLKQTDLEGQIRDEDAAKFGNLAAPNLPALARAFADEFAGGRKFSSIVQARQFASSKLGGAVQPGTMAAKMVDEAVELGVVMRARQIAQGDGTPQSKFDRLVELYDQQPTLGTRTSDSVERQAYSTPIPLAFVASQLARISGSTSVYEPTAGNGALLIEANTDASTLANELDSERRKALEAQGFRVTANDASQPSDATDGRNYARVIANPPFGALKDAEGNVTKFNLSFIQPGYTTGEIDHAIALRALEAMKDDGRAVLIVGGLNKLITGDENRADGYYGKAKREFYYTLYGKYRVVDHFTVPGELYAKQGAAWPVDVIVIDGRGKSSLPFPFVSAPRIVQTWADLRGLLDDDTAWLADGHPNPPGMGPAGGQRGGGGNSLGTGRSGPPPDDDGVSVPPGGSAGVDDGTGRGAPGSSGKAGVRDVYPRPVAGTKPVRQHGGGGALAGGGQLGATSPAGAVGSAGKPGTVAYGGATSRAPSNREHPTAGLDGHGAAEPEDTGVEPGPQRQPSNTKAEKEVATSATQTPYQPASRQQSVETLVPTNLRTAVREALQRVEARGRSVDATVADKLGYSIADLGKYFSAEQVDALALAMEQIDRGSGFVIGDQTGVGKGRFVAGLIRYAERRGLIPIFVTERPNLYTDMARDLTNIGMPEMVDAIFATDAGLRLQLTDDPNGPVLKTGNAKAHQNVIEAATSAQKLPEGKRVMFTTYSQMQRIKGNVTHRMRLMQALSGKAFVILDESHNAGGAGVDADPDGTSRSRFIRDIVSNARSVAYSSATWAKRPDVLDLYGAKTDMRFAVPKLDKLAEAIAKGGVPMQQIVTAQLAQVGQYTRREKSFEGVSYSLRPVEVDRQAYDQVADVLQRIFRVSMFAQEAVEQISKDIRAKAKKISPDRSIGDAGAHSTSFSTVMHNLINQLLLASKAQATVELALQSLREGKKPVIAVANTMGSFIAEFAAMSNAKPGDPLDLNFGSLLKRYLKRTLRYSVNRPFSAQEVHWLKPHELGSEGSVLYRETEELIDRLNLDNFPVVPIDFIRAKLEDAGYRVGEVTGRKEAATYTKDGKVLYRQRSSSELSANARQNTIRAFNGGDLDVIILNQSGATGLSLHASSTFKDQRQRTMLIVQAESNIDTHMQMLGRVHRTGQVIPPEYLQLFANVPAENRPAAVLAKKMASLNASTTANRSGGFSSSDTPDIMNVYGGKVIATLLAEDRDLDMLLGYVSYGGGSSGKQGDEAADYEELARKVTGRLPLLSLARQESVWSEIIDRYNRMLQQADEAGTNVLEAKTLDLNARTLRELTLDDEPPPAGMENNPFAAPAKFAIVDVRRLVRPPSSARILAEIEAMAGLGSVGDLEKSYEGKSEDEIARKIEEVASGADITQRTAELQSKIDDGVRTRLGGIGKQFTDKQKADDASNALMTTTGAMKALMDDAAVGRIVQLAVAGEEAGVTVMVLGYRLRGDRANAPSSWDMIVVDEEGRRLAVPFNSFKLKDDPKSRNLVVRASVRTRQEFLKGLAETAGKTREERVMVTGNILRGYAAVNNKGQIVNYTDSNGELRQGILMPRSFDAEGFLAYRAPSLTPEKAISVLTETGYSTPPFVTHKFGMFTISANDKGGYTLSVIESKERGGPYYLSPAVRNAIGKPFVSRGAKMVAEIGGERLANTLYALQEVMQRNGGSFTSNHEAAKKYAPKKMDNGAARFATGDSVGVETSPPDSAINPEAIAAALEAVRAIVGKNAAVDVKGGLRDPSGRARDVGGVALGPLIMVAVGPRTGWNIHHEAVHALRNLGVLGPKEWATLEDAARRGGWLQEFEILRRYAHLASEGQMEEAVAEKFAQWSAGRGNAPRGGPLARAWNRVKNTVASVRNGLAGRGFQTADDVFKRIASGEVGRRAPGSQAPQRGPTLDQALRMAAFFDTFADVPTDVQAVLDEAARFAIDRSPQGRMSTEQPVTFAAPEEPRTKIGLAVDQLIHDFQNKHKDTKDVLKAIRAAGRTVEESADPYLAEELFHYRVTKGIKDFVRYELEPLIAEMARLNVPLEELERFLWARHAPERNAAIALVNPAFPDGGSGMTNAEAAAHMASITPERRRELDQLARYVDAMTAGTRQAWLRYELEDQRALHRMEDTYEFYVPLQRAEMQDDGPSSTGSGFSVTGPATRRARGSERPVVDIISNIALARERAIIRGEKNIVANALLQLARDHPNPEFWRIDEPPIKWFIDPSTGLWRSMVDPTYKGHDNVVVARSLNNHEHVVEHALIFNKANPRALRMAMAYRNLDVDKIPWLLNTVFGVPTRMLAKLSTQWNPIFGVVNIIRDVGESMINMGSVGLQGRRLQVLRDVPHALAAIYGSVRRERQGQMLSATASATRRQWVDLWDEFQRVGGPTGFRNLFQTASERTEELRRDLDRLLAGKGRGRMRAIGDWISDYNEALENATRVAVYKAAKDAGMSPRRAASIAKNISVNFNRKGAKTNQINALYAFFNAGAQGIARNIQTYASPVGKTIIAGGIVIGMLQSLAMHAAGYDENDIPDFVKERNLIIPGPKGYYVTIPMPLGYQILPNIGRVSMDLVLDGGEDASAKIGKLVRAIGDAFSPLGTSQGGLSALLSPTVTDPIIALETNTSWSGRNIAIPPQSGTDPSPGYMRATRSASWLATQAAYWINTATGGTPNTRGWLSPTPEQLEYLVKQYTGGLGGEATKALKVADALRQGDLPEIKDVPLLSRFVGYSKSTTATSASFYETLKRMREHEAEIKDAAGAGVDVEAYLRKYPEAALYKDARRAQREVSKLQRDLKRVAAGSEEAKAIEENIQAIKDAFLQAVKEAKGR